MREGITVPYDKLAEAVGKLLFERDRHNMHEGKDLYLEAVRMVLNDPTFEFQEGERCKVKELMYTHVYSVTGRPFWNVPQMQDLTPDKEGMVCVDIDLAKIEERVHDYFVSVDRDILDFFRKGGPNKVD